VVVLEYYSVDLQIAKEPEGLNKYIASILENGDTKATQSFVLRRDLKLIQMLKDIEEKAIVPTPQPEETTHIEFGKMLYDTVFSGELGDYFNIRFNEAQEEDCGLRVSMQFNDNVPEIAALPWEYLHNGEDFLVTQRSILLSRLPAGIKKKELKPLDSILRMLVVVSSPDDPGISPLNTEKEQEIILEAVDKLQRDNKIKVDFTEDATFENVQGYLNEQKYHIVHFTGHGVSKNGKGYIVFETEDRKVRLIDNKILADLLSDMGIRLVVLSSCESAKSSNKEAFSDLASLLSKKRIPAVVAMQYSVLDDVAIQFASIFYKTIASKKSVDIALNEARIAMMSSEKSNGFDFASPVLYLSDCNCIQVERIKPGLSEFVSKPMMLPDLQVMKKGFIARKKELRLLETGFKSDVKRAAIIHGFGGMGKTVLATRLALKMNEYFAGIFGMKCSSSTRPEDIMIKINSFLVMKGIFEFNQILNQQVSLEVKTSVLLDIFNQMRFLIILDNFEDCLDDDRKQIKNIELNKFLQHLLNNTISSSKFILTTRYDFDPMDGRLQESIEHISLSELQFPQTNWLMNNYTELADLDIQIKKQIYNLIGGHPWTVGQFAKLAYFQGVASLMLDLKSLKKELIEYTLLGKSFSKLDSDVKKLLLYASVYEEAVPVEALSWIIGDRTDESPFIGESLKKAIQWGLISKEQEYDLTIYMEHTIVRNFSLGKLKEEGIDRKKLLIRAAQYYENLFSQSRNLWDYLKARDYYFQAEDWQTANEIVENAIDYLIRWGHIIYAVNLLNESISTSSGITMLSLRGKLVNVLCLLGDLNLALKIASEVKYQYKEIKDKKGVAYTLHQLGIIYQDQGNYEEAKKIYYESLKMAKKLENRSLIANSQHHLGNIHYLQGNYREAKELYSQSLKIEEDLNNKSGVASSLHALGMIYQEQGNYEEAVNLYNQSLIIKEELNNIIGIAATLHQLGIIHQDQGNYEEAVKLCNQSLEIEKELRNKSGIANSYHVLGNIHCIQENCEEAKKMYYQSLKMREELNDKKGIGETLNMLGTVYYSQHNNDEAEELYNQSLKIAEGLDNKSLTAVNMYSLGNIYFIRQDFDEAEELYNKSLKISEEIGDKIGVAQTLSAFGMINEAEREYVSALQNYLTALSIFQELKSPYSWKTSELIYNLKDKMGEEEFNAVFEKLRN